jgi:hypothetical protein
VVTVVAITSSPKLPDFLTCQQAQSTVFEVLATPMPHDADCSLQQSWLMQGVRARLFVCNASFGACRVT